MKASRKKGTARPGFLLFGLIVLLLAVLAAGQGVSCSLSVLDANPTQGDEVRALLSLKNPNFTDQKIPVLVNYHITGPSGEAAKSESGTFQVTDARDIVLKLQIPEKAESGTYSFRVSMEGQSCSDSFFVGEQDSYFLYIITLAVAALVFVAIFLTRRRR